VGRYAATPLIVTLSSGHSDITRFSPWSPIATGNHLDRPEKNPIFGQTTGTVNVFDQCSGISGTHFAESFRMSKSSRIMDPTRSREMPSYSAIDLAQIRWSSNIS